MEIDNHKEIDRLQILRLLHDAEDGATVSLMITGMSMTPFLFHKQSIVFLKKERGYRPKKGDIVFFVRQDMSPVLHRVIKVKKDGVLVTHIIRTDKKFSVDSKSYRFFVKLWMPFRLIHPPLAYVFNVCHRLPYKLSRKYREKHS